MKQKVSKGQAKVKSAINQRKLVRFFAYFLYLGIIAMITTICFLFLIKKGVFLSHSSANLNFTLDNCTLIISDHNDPMIQNPIYAKYRIPQEIAAEQKSAKLSMNTDSDPQTFSVSNGLGTRYCEVELFVKESTPINSLKINCPSCSITQNTSFQLEITNALNIIGDTVHANFRDIKVGSLNFDATSGYLQLSNIVTSSGGNIVSVLDRGDIIIQSTQNFRVNAYTNTQAFCFNGPSLTEVTNNKCAVSGDSSTTTSKSSTDCQIIYDLCTAAGCSTPPAQFTVNSKYGNVYANIISAVGKPTSSTDTPVKGQIYDDGIQFDPIAEGAVAGFDTLANDQSKGNPFVILDIGDIESRSALYTKWVLSSAPSYGLMRPWWIGTLSATILNGYTERVSGFLLPGFCPYFPQYTYENLLEMQSLIEKKTNVENALITFVNDDNMSLPPRIPQESTGVFEFSQSRNPFDKWFSLNVLSNGNIALSNNDYTSKGQILAAVILSLVIATFVAFLCIELVIVGINLMYIKLVNFANHLDSYSKLEKTKLERSLEKSADKKSKPKVVDISKYTFTNIMKNSPSPSAFVDYLSLIVYRQFSNSVAQYYKLLFKQVSLRQIQDEELDPNRDMIKGTDAKVLYEKFCFMNHLNEEKLTDKVNVSILESYGFEIQVREDLLSEVFTRMNVKNYDNYLTSAFNSEENQNSLEIYMKENIEITEFQEDQVEVELFTKIYYAFCDYNRLPRVLISSSLMKEKFDIDVNMVPQQFIIRKENTQDDDFRSNEKLPISQRLINWWIRLKTPKSKTYVIDNSKLENNFKLVMGKITELTDVQLEEATVDLILYPRWWLWDVITVAFHMIVGGAITVPLVLLVILNESQYEPWSLKNPQHLIAFNDIARDPATLIQNLYTSYGWNMAIMVIVSILWAMNFLDLILYYGVMEFPQDKSFKRSEDEGESFWQKLSRRLEWILTLLALAFYFGYIGVVLTWLLLGAFINPNAFLPFASAAVTFVTFVATKYKAFRTLSDQGTKAVMTYLKDLFGGFINKVMGKLTDSIEKATSSIADKGKAVLKNDNFKSVTGKLTEAGIVDAKAIAEYTSRVEALDSKAIVAGAVTAVNDPTVIFKELENLTNSMVSIYSKYIS